MLGPVLLLVGILTMSGYFQLFAEPYVMTQGGPLESTKSVLYLMYDEGFKWWNLGNASAVAFLLFVLMVAVTSGLLWLARRTGVEGTVPSPPPSSTACWSRGDRKSGGWGRRGGVGVG